MKLIETKRQITVSLVFIQCLWTKNKFDINFLIRIFFLFYSFWRSFVVIKYLCLLFLSSAFEINFHLFIIEINNIFDNDNDGKWFNFLFSFCFGLSKSFDTFVMIVCGILMRIKKSKTRVLSYLTWNESQQNETNGCKLMTTNTHHSDCRWCQN